MPDEKAQEEVPEAPKHSGTPRPGEEPLAAPGAAVADADVTPMDPDDSPEVEAERERQDEAVEEAEDRGAIPSG